ncbi:MAG: HU family DNA-binding protein [Persicimonas sp.]
MTKAELIDAVNKKAADQDIELTKKDTKALVDIVFETVAGSIEDEKRFSYPNFGTFNVKHRKAREGRNPQTGAPIQIKASNTVGFKPSPSLKDQIN